MTERSGSFVVFTGKQQIFNVLFGIHGSHERVQIIMDFLFADDLVVLSLLGRQQGLSKHLVASPAQVNHLTD